MALDDIMRQLRAFDGDKARRAAVSLMFTPAGQRMAQKAQGAANYNMSTAGNFSKLAGGVAKGAGAGPGVPGGGPADIAQTLYALKDDAIDAVNVSSRSLWNNTGQGLFTKGIETAGGESSAFLDNRVGRTAPPQFGKRPYGGPDEEDAVEEDEPADWGPLRPTDTEDVGSVGQVPGWRPVGPPKPPKGGAPTPPSRGNGGLILPGQGGQKSTAPRPWPYPL